MPLHRLILFLLLLGVAAIGTGGGVNGQSPCLVPVQMEGGEEGAEVPVARIKVGHTDATLRLALDFSGVGVTVSSYVPWIRSTSYMMASGIDVIELCHRRIRLPVRYDPDAAFLAGCPTCDGTFGLGRFNPLWMVWKRVILSGGAMILDDGKQHHAIELPSSTKRSAPMPCTIGHAGFCLTQVRMGNRTYQLDFAFRTQETYLPPKIYDEYVGVRSLDKDPPKAWKNLVMWMGDTKIVVRREHIIPMSHTGSRKLLVKPNIDHENTIVLGRSAWRAVRILRDTETETLSIMNWNCCKSHTSWGWVILIVAGLLLLRWKSTHDNLWIRGTDGLYPDRLLIEVFTAIVGFSAYFLPSVRDSLGNFKLFSVYAIVVISTMVAWMIFTLVIYYAGKTEWFGDVFLVAEKPSGLLQRRRRSPPFAMHGAPLPREKRRIPPPEGTELLRLSPRIAIIRTVVVETILLLATVLVLTETREDTLTGLFPFLFTLGYLFILLYWAWLALYYTPNIKPMGIWMLWWIYFLGLLGVSLWVTAVEIVVPFFEREVPELVWQSEVSAVMVYVFLGYWATRMGTDSVNEERRRLYYLGVRYIGPYRIVRPPLTSKDSTPKVVVAYPRARPRNAGIPISATPPPPPTSYYIYSTDEHPRHQSPYRHHHTQATPRHRHM